MANDVTPLDQLKIFLNQLFQFETQDLDFGVYKILHYKRKEIKAFLDKLLVDKVKEQLQTLSAEESAIVQDKIAELEKDIMITGWLKADDDEKKTLEKFGKEKINQYLDLKGKSTEANVSAETENQIYNHLTLLFSRYYDKGDFISKRRFGKNEKYVVPYNGEETHFHWANHDQYYIKSSETFQKFAFKIPISDGTMVINFKLTEAQIEQGNVKADEPNYFILSEKNPETGENETTFFFEYRPLTDDEKKNTKGNNKQDTLNEQAFETIKAQHLYNSGLGKLWETDSEGRALLLKKLNHYTRKNKYDFFIHKNLKGFLQRELDYYIKSELMNVDDLYVSVTEAHFNRLKHNLKTIKVFKSIADTIIDFVSQIEEFQKKLWEKKKFVLSTEWVITIDRLVEYIGEDAAKPILEEVIKNESQLKEWKQLFGEEILPQKLSLDTLKADLHTWRKLPIDTKNFSNEFKVLLINKLHGYIDISKKIDGILLHSDNFQGLNLMNEQFYRKIKAIYIDPPYNTDATEITYKNGFKHSSWSSLIENRVNIGRKLGSNNGLHCITIDDAEYNNLFYLLDKEFSRNNYKATVLIRNNPSGRSTVSGFSINHEYALFYSNSEDVKEVGKLPHSEKQIERYNEIENDGRRYEWENLRRNGPDSNKEDRPKQYYPIVINVNGSIELLEMEWDEEAKVWKFDKNSTTKSVVFPIHPDGTQKVWRYSKENIENEPERFCWKKVNDLIEVYRKKYLNTEGLLPRTWWDNPLYSARDNGTRDLINLFGTTSTFDFPKAVHAVKDCIKVCKAGKNDFILDYFPGSGTTFHATQILNKEDRGFRKCILIEQGDYFYTVIIPRIKKIAYTYEWKDGKPKNGTMSGLGVFFKYQRLEQYEEALENIAFTASDDATQKALEFEQYIPKYFLEFETKGSKTLVNTAAMKDPWCYKLKVWDGFTYDTEQAVDLAETFNYLIGLHMQKCITKEINGRKYQFVVGNNNENKQIVVVWRNVTEWTLDDYKSDSEILKKELAAFTYDLLYINDQAYIEGYQPIEEVFKNKMLN
jgi:adenine-specific DNA-methyltransferase